MLVQIQRFLPSNIFFSPEMKESKLIFTPLPLLTHLVPAVQLAKQLISRHRQSNLSITFIIMKLPFDAKAQSYSRSISADSKNSALQFVYLPDPDPDFSSDATSPASYFSKVMEAQKPLFRKAVAEIIAESKPIKISGLVVEMMGTSAMIDVANEFGVPTYCSSMSGAGTLGIFHFHSLKEDANQEITDYNSSSDFEISMPFYTNPVPVKLLPTSFFDKDGMSSLLHFVRRLRETKGIILNTFKELESNAINALLDDKTLPPIYAVGPVVNFEGISIRNQENDSVMKWLDDQPISSVVFLSFGSGGSFKDDQVKEIAYALEQSGNRFIWSLRCASGEKGSSDVLPEGFLIRTQGIGIVVPWVAQVQVLSHPSVGGFVTHCGWSSLMEGVYFGVPMAVWPMHSDQQMTAFLLVKELNLAVDIKMDYRLDFKNTDPTLVNADKIENGIRQLMDPKSGIRANVKEMKEKARMSVLEGGSSYISMETVIQDIFHDII